MSNEDCLPKELRFEQTLGNQLTVKLVSYGYAAFTAGRFPTAVGIIGGNSAAGFGEAGIVDRAAAEAWQYWE